VQPASGHEAAGFSMHSHDSLYIGGELVAPAGDGVIEVMSPHSGEPVGRVPDGTNAEFGCPFGGFKASGLGRELGPEGLEAYLEYQSVSLPPEG
jgi:acyl-CoA reductase-like NAD-dependent aldehyde dehydrogenase